jgi:predicted nucleic acid-binding protein
MDVNVVLDFVLSREPFVAGATALLAAAENGQAQLFVPAHGVTTVFYVVARHRSAAVARRVVADLLLVTRVAVVNDAVVRRALALGWPDFEDAVCAAAAEGEGCDLLVTRDPAGFAASPVLAVDPVAALAVLGQGPGGPERVSEGQAGAYGTRHRRTPRAVRGRARMSR